MKLNIDISKLLFYRIFYRDAFNNFYFAFSIPIF